MAVDAPVGEETDSLVGASTGTEVESGVFDGSGIDVLVATGSRVESGMVDGNGVGALVAVGGRAVLWITSVLGDVLPLPES